MLRVLVVGDDVLARGGLVALLAGRRELELAGQAGTASRAHPAPRADVVLWDAGASGSPLIVPTGIPPIVSLLADEQGALAALAAGARGVLPREAPVDRLVAALVAVSEGLLVVDESFSESVFRRGPGKALVEPLTPREGQVLGLLAEGLSNRVIATRLAISESTAKFHVNAILGKLGAETRSEAIVLAVRLGLVAL